MRRETQPFFGEAFEERRPWAIKREDRRAGFARRSLFGFWICFSSSHWQSPGFAPRLESSVVVLPAPLQPGGRQGDISTLPKGDISILLPQENLFSFSGVAASATRRGGLPDGDAAMIEAGG